jgi:hypothetical protein
LVVGLQSGKIRPGEDDLITRKQGHVLSGSPEIDQVKFPISARFWMSSFFTPDERIFHQRPIRKLWSQCNDSIDHAYMGFDRNRVRFMIAHDFVGIGKWLPGKPQASVNVPTTESLCQGRAVLSAHDDDEAWLLQEIRRQCPPTCGPPHIARHTQKVTPITTTSMPAPLSCGLQTNTLSS